MEWKSLSTFTTGTGIFNGDMGLIDKINLDAGTIGVIFDGEKYVTYDYVSAEELESAFAMTVHKSQGSEFPVVILPVTNFPPMLSTRNLIYTAITRAKQAVVLVGNPAVCNAMVDNNSIQARYSGLDERLQKLWDAAF